MTNFERWGPAIPDDRLLYLSALFVELRERVTAFEDRDHDLMRFRPGRIKGPLEGQISLF